MEALRDDLVKLGRQVPTMSPRTPFTPTLLARLSQTHVALLQTAPSSPASSDSAALLHILPLTTQRSMQLPLPPPIDLPKDAHTLIPASDMLAVIGTRSISIIDCPLSSNPNVSPVARPLFTARPALSVLHAVWAPHAPGFLLVLTSDSTLRLFDVISPTGADTERLRLRVVANAAPPVSVAFGRGHAWSALSVYVLMADGTIFVVAPVAPIGTRIPFHVWSAMQRTAAARAPSQDDLDNPSWSARQNDMQLRFLNHVFERSPAGDMVAVREFKPAPLLFQGPLFIEQDDLNKLPKQMSCKFTSLAYLHCGTDVPPILLRASEDGQVSVLIGLESLEPQWFLSTDAAIASSGEAPVEASEEYVTCASQVAPSLLCYEHVSFGSQPIWLLPLGGTRHADVVFVLTQTAVYSLRLSFISALSDAQGLERAANSSIALMLSTGAGTAEVHGTTTNPASQLLGLAPHYVHAQGPVAIALTADGQLHVSSPVRWASPLDVVVPPALLPETGLSQLSWSESSPSSAAVGGRRAFAATELGKEVAQLLQSVRRLEERAGGRIATGSLGRINEVKKFSRVLDLLEARIVLYSGGSDRPGIVDTLGALASVLSTFGKKLGERVHASRAKCTDVDHDIADAARSEMEVQRKLACVQEVGGLLEERVQNLLEMMQNLRLELSPAERARYEKLKDRSRRLAFMRGRIAELSAAVKNLGSNGEGSGDLTPNQTAPSTPDYKSSAGRPGYGNGFSRRANGLSRRDDDGPLARRRPEWSGRQVTSLSMRDVQRIRVALEKHSTEIATAMQLDAALRKRLIAS